MFVMKWNEITIFSQFHHCRMSSARTCSLSMRRRRRHTYARRRWTYTPLQSSSTHPTERPCYASSTWAMAHVYLPARYGALTLTGPRAGGIRPLDVLHEKNLRICLSQLFSFEFCTTVCYFYKNWSIHLLLLYRSAPVQDFFTVLRLFRTSLPSCACSGLLYRPAPVQDFFTVLRLFRTSLPSCACSGLLYRPAPVQDFFTVLRLFRTSLPSCACSGLLYRLAPVQDFFTILLLFRTSLPSCACSGLLYRPAPVQDFFTVLRLFRTSLPSCACSGLLYRPAPVQDFFTILHLFLHFLLFLLDLLDFPYSQWM